MNRWLLIIFTISIACTEKSEAKIKDAITIHFDLPVYSDQTIKLGYYYGNVTFLADSLRLDSKGSSIYSSDYNEGLYILILPDSSTFEFMITEGTDYRITCTSSMNSELLTLDANPVAEAYVDYINIFQRYRRESDSLRDIARVTSNLNQKNEIKDQLQLKQNLLDSASSEFIRLYEGSLPANYVKSLQTVRIPVFENAEEVKNTDSVRWLNALNFHRDHYFDNITWNDSRLIYTPVIPDKIDYFLDRIIGDHPLQISSAIDTIIQMSGNPDIREFVLSHLFYRYQRLKHDATSEYVYLHLSRKYLLNEKASWMTDTEFLNLQKEYEKLMPVSLFSKAPDISLPDRYKKTRSLNGTSADYTIIFFWDYSCSTCRRVLTELVKVVSKYNYININVFTVYTGTDLEVWEAFVTKRIPSDWINTYQTGSVNYPNLYNIARTPTLFILDEDKKIQDKDLTVPEIDSFLFRTLSGKKMN